MHRDELRAKELRRERTGYIRAADGLARALETIGDPREDRLRGDARPVDAEPVVLEAKQAATIVVRHHEEHLCVRNSADARTAHDALKPGKPTSSAVPVERLRGGSEHGRQEAADGSRHGALLDDEAFLEGADLARVDDSGDAGSHGGAPVLSPTDGIDLAPRVVREPEHIAIAAEPLSDAVRTCQPSFLRAH